MDMKERLAKELREKRAADQAKQEEAMERSRIEQEQTATRAEANLMSWLNSTEEIVSALIKSSFPNETTGFIALDTGFARSYQRRGVGALNSQRFEGEVGDRLVAVEGGDRLSPFDGEKAFRSPAIQTKIQEIRDSGISIQLLFDTNRNAVVYYEYRNLLSNN